MDIVWTPFIYLPFHYASVKHLHWQVKETIIICLLCREMLEYILTQSFIFKEKMFKNLVYILILKHWSVLENTA